MSRTRNVEQQNNNRNYYFGVMLRKVSVGNLNGNDDFGLRPAPVARNGDNRAGGTALMSS